MRLLWTLFLRELKLSSRVKFFYLTRMGMITVVGFFFWSIFQGQVYDKEQVIGLKIFSIFSYFMTALLMFLAPLSSCQTISQEKEKKTLELLLLTNLQPSNIVLGKFISTVFASLMVYLSCIPLFMFCFSLGGISGEQILIVSSLTCIFLLLSNAVGICASTFLSSKNAQGISSLAILAIVGIGFLIDQFAARGYLKFYIGEGEFSLYFTTYFCFSPFTALQRAFAGGNSLYSCYSHMSYQLLLTLILLSVSSYGLPFAYNQSTKAPLKTRIKRYFKNIWRGRGQSKNNPIPSSLAPLKLSTFLRRAAVLTLLFIPCAWALFNNFPYPKMRFPVFYSFSIGVLFSMLFLFSYPNPIMWHDYHKMYGGKLVRNIKILVSLIGITGVLTFLCLTSPPSSIFAQFFSNPLKVIYHREFIALITGFSVFMLVFFVGSIFSQLLRTFTREKERKSWDLLLLTGLSNGEIILGKVVAVLKSAFPFLFLAISGGAYIIWMWKPRYSSPSDFHETIFYISFFLSSYALVFCSCALFCSFVCQNLRKASYLAVGIFTTGHFFWGLAFKSVPKEGIGFIFLFFTFLFIYHPLTHLRTSRS